MCTLCLIDTDLNDPPGGFVGPGACGLVNSCNDQHSCVHLHPELRSNYSTDNSCVGVHGLYSSFQLNFKKPTIAGGKMKSQ